LFSCNSAHYTFNYQEPLYTLQRTQYNIHYLTLQKSTLCVKGHMQIGTMFCGVLYVVFTSNCQSCTEVIIINNILKWQPIVLWYSLLIEYDVSSPLLFTPNHLWFSSLSILCTARLSLVAVQFILFYILIFICTYTL